MCRVRRRDIQCKWLVDVVVVGGIRMNTRDLKSKRLVVDVVGGDMVFAGCQIGLITFVEWLLWCAADGIMGGY